VKCPKCGFVSYPGLTQCKKCGHSFSPSKRKVEPEKAPSPPPPAAGLEADTPLPPAEESFSPRALSPSISPALTAPEPLEEEETAETWPGPSSIVPEQPAPEPDRPWREELSERVESYRQRRARLKKGFDESSSLEFDFPHASGAEAEAPLPSAEAGPKEMGSELDFDLNHSQDLDDSDLPLDVLTFLGRGEGSGILQQAESELADELPPPAPAAPVEIVLDSSPDLDEERGEAAPISLPLAPMGRRFLGGILDALVLLASAGLFALIYWRAGGVFTGNLLTFAVAAFIGVLICLAYFGVFTALTSTTPGLLWMGIEVRNLQGNPPTTRQVFWRSFGYLVSTSALLLGFVWALVDSEGLTWHDRMSDTYLTSVEGVEARLPSTVQR
jgi:uncharacterized RDD family membrane protein YckC